MTERRVPFFDLAASLNPVKEQLDAAWAEVYGHGGWVGGPAVGAFEQAFADYCEINNCIGLANGTDALELALRALGVGPGDEVIIPANTFIATAEAVSNVGATPVFADIDPATLLMRPIDVEPMITPRTAALMPVHLYGQPCDMAGFASLAEKAQLALIEDAAQAHGSRCDGLAPGALSDAATFSFYPGKNLGALGDGGALVTRHDDLAEKIRSISAHGRSLEDRYLHDVVGCNSRLDTLQAAFLSVRLTRLDEENNHRRRVRDLYEQLLPASVQLVKQEPGRVSSNHLIVAEVDEREDFRRELETRGVQTGLHYPVPCHLQKAYFEGGNTPSKPVAESAARRIVSLPVWGQMPEDDVVFVCEQIGALRR